MPVNMRIQYLKGIRDQKAIKIWFFLHFFIITTPSGLLFAVKYFLALKHEINN